ncbi:Dolichyl-phosphate-mannose-protein mannosyltransferase [Singulisphaera sp. GP187]|uniref:ArnT family glycosyltransferase n=1 Tax=Singulisphaera sp. GP187 TaxID=1882752 RepID=UPI000929C86F|nr:glycosyltransferase family 39 protein [Singulisphaera sp. GP187]SIN79750.1 Dolichyl-phosphate-mannose-protein mannosyltransferase [Singulisphaera sp. GP187]
MTSRRSLWFLIVISTSLRLAWSASLGLGNDEAYHYLFATHHDWSYFDHPPMLALVERLGIVLSGGVVSPFRLRLGFILLFAGSTWLMARLTERFYGPRAGFLAALALNLTAYHSVAAGAFVLPDGPLLFFWLLTLDRLAVAIDSGGRLGPWLGVGVAWGAAMLSKYHAVFLPVGTFLYFLLEPTARHWLRRAGPYVATAIGLALFSPVIWWNATHGWASFAFQGARALGGLRFRPDTLGAAVLGQALYLFPWVWLALVSILIRNGRRFFSPSETAPADRFLLCQAIVPLSIFMAVACTRSVLPHWTLVGFLSIFPLLGRKWEEEPARLHRRIVVFATLLLFAATVVLVQTRTGVLQQGGEGTLGLIKVSRDPTLDLYGWDEVSRELERRGLLDRPNTFLFTSNWYYSGHVAFATRNHATPVACYSAGDARSFAFWSKPSDWMGQDGILISMNGRSVEPHCFDRFFSRIELLGEFEVKRSGTPIRKIRLFHCVRQIVPFPFDQPRPPSSVRTIAQSPTEESAGETKPAVLR